MQGIFVFFYYWFIGLQALDHLFYVFSIQLIALFSYLAYRWIQDGKMYRWVQSETKSTTIPNIGSTPFASELYNKQIELNQLRDRKVHTMQSQMEGRVHYMNQWVHQMKTPLSVINLTIQEEDDPIFQQLKKEVLQIEYGLENLLYSSRLDLFERDFKVEAVSLSHIVDEAIKDYKRFFIQHSVYPRKNKEVESDIVYTDQKWLIFALGQLITNAVKYSADSSDHLDIRIFNKGKKVVLEVKDYGIGIPSQDLKRVFDPYYTGENGRRFHESTGMGLYLVKEIIYKLHHEVELASEVGTGTTVQFLFTTTNLTKM